MMTDPENWGAVEEVDRMKAVAERMRRHLSFWHIEGSAPGGALSEDLRVYLPAKDAQSLASLKGFVEELLGDTEEGRARAAARVDEAFAGHLAEARLAEMRRDSQPKSEENQ